MPKRPSFRRNSFQTLIASLIRSIRRHAPRDEPLKDETFRAQLLHPDYFYNHSEPHRRRPTLVRFPHFISHTATFFGRTTNPRTEFKEWLQMFRRDEWRRRSDIQNKQDELGNPNESDPALWKNTDPVVAEVLDNFSLIAQTSSQEEVGCDPKHPQIDVEFALEFLHRDEPGVVARIEAHLEFFTLTLFKPLPENFHFANVYEDYGGQLVPDEPDRSETPFHVLYKQLVRRFPKETFAHFQGVVVSPEVFDSSRSQPVFANPGDSGPLSSESTLKTARFLREQKYLFEKSVFVANDEDVVACYFQHGQAIYVSALGAQRSPDSKDVLRYLLIYNTPSIDGHAYDPLADRYRLSRLVHRINAIGTLRLAALRDLRELRTAGDELRRIESAMEMAAHEGAPIFRYHKLHDKITLLENMALSSLRNGVPLLYRTARSGLYFNQMKKLLADLSPDPIPTWQSYDQFLSRRLFAQHEFTATLGNRMSELWTNARTRAEVAEALTLGWLRSAAEIGSMFLLPLAVADMARGRTNVSGWLFRVVGFRIPQEVTDWFHGFEIQEFWLVYAITFCVWGTFIIWVSCGSKRTLT